MDNAQLTALFSISLALAAASCARDAEGPDHPDDQASATVSVAATSTASPQVTAESKAAIAALTVVELTAVEAVKVAAEGPIESPASAVARIKQHGGLELANRGDIQSRGGAPDVRSVAYVDATSGTHFDVAIILEGGGCYGPEMRRLLAFARVARDGTLTMPSHPLEDPRGPYDPNLCPPVRHRGRMFEGFCDLEIEKTLLEYLVRAHRQEAAAVVAFERLAAELAALGAPATLVDRARVAADDERRHAALFLAEARALAGRGDVQVPPLESVPTERRSLEAMLTENAVEGCVHETYAAITATHQAASAPSARLRALFGDLASEERAHSALAYAVHAWGLAVLDRNAAARVEASRLAALAESTARGADVTPFSLAMGEPPAELASAALPHVASRLMAATI